MCNFLFKDIPSNYSNIFHVNYTFVHNNNSNNNNVLNFLFCPLNKVEFLSHIFRLTLFPLSITLNSEILLLKIESFFFDIVSQLSLFRILLQKFQKTYLTFLFVNLKFLQNLFHKSQLIVSILNFYYLNFPGYT